MVVREIEEMIRAYVETDFKDTTGNVDKVKLDAAVVDILPSNASEKGKFRQAIQHYLSSGSQPSSSVDQQAVDAAFDKYLLRKPQPRPFEKLTLTETISLLLHNDRWPRFKDAFALDRKAIKRLLERVRDTRNALAHFRDEHITEHEREELRFCKEWLARHERDIIAAFASANRPVITGTSNTAQGNQTSVATATVGSTSQGVGPVSTLPTTPNQTAPDKPVQPIDGEETSPAPLDELPTSTTGRYAPLIRHLVEQPANVAKVTLAFDEIDALLGEHRLPESARKLRTWWANDSTSHSQSQQWLEAGWRVANITLSEARVTFARIQEYEQAYMAFFNALQSELERAAPGMFSFTPSNGQYYIGLGTVATPTKNIASFFCAFTRTRRFRVELLIDTYEQAATKQIFDALYERKAQIEDEIGEKLSWERIDDKRPSRIARYYSGTINDTTGALANLRARAVEAAQRIVPVLRRHMAEVVPGVLGVPVVDAVEERRP